MSRLTSRVVTRRQSRIGLRVSSIAMAFARSGPAWLNGVEVPANTPRYPSQSGTVGALVEEAATNLCLRSSEFDNAAWVPTGLDFTPNAETAPDGTLTADRIVSNNIVNALRQTITVTASTTYTFSFYAKNNSGTRATYSIYNVTGAADIVAATSYLPQINNSTWTRVSVTFTTPVGCTSIYVYPMRNPATSGVNLYLWGAQLEAKGYATTYIPTVAASVIRNAETLTVPTQGLLAPSAGTVTIRAYVDSVLAGTLATSRFLFDAAELANKNRIALWKTGATWRATVFDAAGLTTTAQASTALSVGFHTFTIQWSAARLSLLIDGVEVAFQLAPKIPAVVPPQGRIGCDYAGGAQLNQPIPWAATYADASPAAAAAIASPAPDFTAYLRFTNGQMEALLGHPWGAAEYVALLDAAHAN